MHASRYAEVRPPGSSETGGDVHEPLFSKSIDAVLLCTDGIIDAANHAAIALLAAETSAALVGMPLHHVVVDREWMDLFYSSIAEGETVSSEDVRIRRLNGSEFNAELIALPTDGRTVHIVIRDGAERRHCKAMLVHASARAERLEHLKQTFLMNVSHEIRTPLTGVLGFADILAKEVDGRHRELALMMRRNAERLMQTLTSILDLAHLEYGEVALSVGPLDLSRHLAETVEVFSARAAAAGLYLEVEMSAHDRVQVDADAVALRRIFEELLANAIKFTHRGGIVIRVEARDASVAIHVEDTGIGIREEALPHIFDDFTQESAGVGRDFEGAGLGLTICRRLAKLMHGSLTARRERGRGSTFTLTLPRSRALETPPSSLGHGAGKAESDGSRPRILALDDGDELGAMLTHALGDEFVVDIVFDQADALEWAYTRRYPLIFLSVEAADGSSAIDSVMDLRRATNHQESLILAVLPRALSDDRASLLLAGFDGCIRKPLRLDDLLRLVETVRTTP